MAIDSEAKRRSAIATRRLPWFRRFIPLPDGSIGQGDRQSLAFVYSGIAADVVPQPDTIGRRVRINRTVSHEVEINRTISGVVKISRTISGTVERN